MLQPLRTPCWYCDNCITWLWALSSYFLYLYMVFIQQCFHSEQHYFTVLQTFQTDWVQSNPKSSLVIQNYFSIDYHCILSISTSAPICKGDLIFISALNLNGKLIWTKDNPEDFGINTCHQPRDWWSLRRRPQIFNQKGSPKEWRS